MFYELFWKLGVFKLIIVVFTKTNIVYMIRLDALAL